MFRLVILLLLASISFYDHTVQAQKPNRTNLVLIMADDVGIECFGCYGSDEYSTPKLDRIAEQGIRFTNCHSSPLCTPSRVKIMTGQSNIRNYYDFSILRRQEKTFGHMLQRAGYRTAVAGKWQLLGAEHYGEQAGTGTRPEQAGFDEHCLWQVTKLGPRYWKPQLEINGKLTKFGKDKYGPDECTNFVCDFIQRNREQPFFVYYPMILPHNPFRPTPLSTNRQNKDKKQNFVDMVSYMDDIVGRIVESLKTAGVAERTALMFVSDNGTNQSIRSKWRGKMVRGGKSKTIDAGTHVPMIVYAPGQFPGGRVCNDLVDLSDFMPTIAELTAAELPDTTIDGISFAPQLRGISNPSARDVIYCYYNPRPGKKKFPRPVVYARDKQWKLYADGRLFDVIEDRVEMKPIMQDSETDAARQARKKLQNVIESMPKKSLAIKPTNDNK